MKIILILFLITGCLFAQIITNVQVRQEGLFIIITYDMASELQGIDEIVVDYSTDGGRNYIPIADAEGDVGNNVKPGTRREISFIASDTFVGESLKFKVNSRPKAPDGMVAIPGGTFDMGCGSWTSDCEDDEKPVHTVTISSFYIGVTEVTQAQWRAVMGTNPSYSKGDDLPVELVSWNDIQKFLKKLNRKTGQNYRLPTEAEWEYAARSGGKKEKYAGTSSNLEDYAWYSYNSDRKTHPVGQKIPNGLGLYDMIGNVQEWCSDGYDGNYYTTSPVKDPDGAYSGSFRVFRGGSCFMNDIRCRSSNRGESDPDNMNFIIGFRFARDL